VTHIANYKKVNFVEVSNAATGGKGVDLIVDMVGQAHFACHLDALATDGCMVMLSLISGSPPHHFTQFGVVPRQWICRFRSSMCGPWTDLNEAPPHSRLHSMLAVNRIQDRFSGGLVMLSS